VQPEVTGEGRQDVRAAHFVVPAQLAVDVERAEVEDVVAVTGRCLVDRAGRVKG
jgi:hypothetical protein